MAYGDEDLAAALADAAGEELWFGSQVLDAILDEGDLEVTDEMGTQFTVRGVSARVQTSAVPAALKVESALVRGATGTSYRVRDVRRLAPDGALTLLVLAKA